MTTGRAQPSGLPGLLHPEDDAFERDLAVAIESLHRLRPLAADSTHLRGGGAWLLDDPDEIEAVWGRDTEVLWAAGEPAGIVADQGLGKTTLAQQVVLHCVGIRSGDLLGLPVKRVRRALYLAMDRPRQAKRSLRRMVGPEDRAVLDERLIIWEGPPPKDFALSPEVLLELCQEADADLVVIDSVKDAAVGLNDDKTGAGFNRAIQIAIAGGVEVLLLHHPRKAQDGNRKPSKADDAFGSKWVTAGWGSIIFLLGQPGDSFVKLLHVKQPSEVVGPLNLVHDHDVGVTTIEDGADPLALLRAAKGGLNAKDLARALTGKTEPDKNQVRAARRKLDRLVAAGLATKQEGTLGGVNPSGSTYKAAPR